MSAIVTDLVPRWAGPAVVSCIPCSSSKSRGGDPNPGWRARRRSSCCYRYSVLLLDVGQEQRLVDSALEDRHAQLHALLDDLATFHAGFASELRGREMDCHQYESSCEVCHVCRHRSAFTGCPQCQPAQPLLNIRSDRVLLIEERVFDRKAVRQQTPERSDAEGFRGVMTGAHEVD